MTRVSLFSATILLLGGFALAVPPLSNPVLAADHPLTLVQRVYRLPDPDFGVFYDKKRRRQFYTPRIVRLIAEKEACFKAKFKMDELDFNYIVPGQDYAIRSLTLSLLKQDEGSARVRVEFSGPDTKARLDYHLENDAGRWLVDDVVIGPNDSLSKSLDGPC
jgi:hypothetical protein